MNRIKESVKTFLDAFAAQMSVVFRDQGILLILCFLTFGYPILYSLIYNPELVRDVETVVIDHDRTALSREAVRRMDATQYLKVLGYAADLPEARRAVNEHKAYCIIEIPENFERNATGGEGTQMVLYCEMSLLLRYRSMLTAAIDVSQAMGADLSARTLDGEVPGAASLLVEDPLGIHSVFLGDTTGGFASFVMPGILILILQQLICLMCGLSGGARHEYPLELGFNPLARRPHTLAKMLGEMLCFYIISLPMAIWLIHYVPMIFSFPQAGDVWQEMLFITPLILSSICLGFVLQGIVWQREGIFVIWVVTSLVFLFLSGLTWPYYAAPRMWQYVADALPSTWGVQGFILMNSNGSSLTQVAHFYHNLWWLTLGYSLVAYCVQRWIVRPDVRRRYIMDAGTAQDADTTAASES